MLSQSQNNNQPPSNATQPKLKSARVEPPSQSKVLKAKDSSIDNLKQLLRKLSFDEDTIEEVARTGKVSN